MPYKDPQDLKRYKADNKERLSAYKKGWAKANKDKIAAQNKRYSDSLKNDFFTLYYLPRHNYIGVSNQPLSRMKMHKKLEKDISNWVTIKTFKTKREALDAEKFYHSIGYKGANPRTNLINNII
tara:strand:+ start:123 stop:494 length:372 start_codon:yes stop_codon:yes gene_type:complete